MLTWHRGRAIISERIHARTCPMDGLLARLESLPRSRATRARHAESQPRARRGASSGNAPAGHRAARADSSF